VVRDEELEGWARALLWAGLRWIRPTPVFRRRAWREFQRALDPLAPPKDLPQHVGH
jgi:hypothetical protein